MLCNAAGWAALKRRTAAPVCTPSKAWKVASALIGSQGGSTKLCKRGLVGQNPCPQPIGVGVSAVGLGGEDGFIINHRRHIPGRAQRQRRHLIHVHAVVGQGHQGLAGLPGSGDRVKHIAIARDARQRSGNIDRGAQGRARRDRSNPPHPSSRLGSRKIRLEIRPWPAKRRGLALPDGGAGSHPLGHVGRAAKGCKTGSVPKFQTEWLK